MKKMRDGTSYPLGGMMNDGEITSQQAVETARKVLRGNAIKLYKLNGSQMKEIIEHVLNQILMI